MADWLVALSRHTRFVDRNARPMTPRFDLVRRAALATLPAGGAGLSLEEFRSKLATRLRRTKGWDPTLSAPWYGMAIKLDLEARGELVRSGTPQRLTRA